MAFDDTIRENALLACGRHCCICHRFCGIKMELHHIRLHSEEGEDSFENCIPLCFDCHSEMKSYDFKHPKGTKYTPSELQRHRDNWYKKIAETGKVNFSDSTNLDLATFKRLQTLIPWDGGILFARNHNFDAAFDVDIMQQFYQFLHECENPSFEFFDADLEGARTHLKEKILEFDSLAGVSTFRVGNTVSMNAVPRDWEYDNPERYVKTVKSLNQAGSKVAEAYDNLIRFARKILGAS